jgi:hypothetical protein
MSHENVDALEAHNKSGRPRLLTIITVCNLIIGGIWFYPFLRRILGETYPEWSPQDVEFLPYVTCLFAIWVIACCAAYVGKSFARALVLAGFAFVLCVNVTEQVIPALGLFFDEAAKNPHLLKSISSWWWIIEEIILLLWFGFICWYFYFYRPTPKKNKWE